MALGLTVYPADRLKGRVGRQTTGTRALTEHGDYIVT